MITYIVIGLIAAIMSTLALMTSTKHMHIKGVADALGTVILLCIVIVGWPIWLVVNIFTAMHMMKRGV